MKVLKLILFRLLLVMFFILSFILTILYVSVMFVCVTIFGVVAWLCTGSIWGWIPDRFPDIFKLWNKVEKLSHTINDIQKEVDEKK